jgi:hypothetical protein
MKIKTNELTRAALNWAVAECEGVGVWYDDLPQVLRKTQGNEGEYAPSDDWAQGGPIIDREDIAMSSKPDGLWAAYAPKGTRLVQHGGQAVEVFNWTYKQQGYTPLIAAMRCYVASKLGDEVEIPKELT